MKVLWLDPLNTNPHFVNLLSLALGDAGHRVEVCSVVRDGHPPPPEVPWTPFMRFRPPPSSLKKSALATLRALASYEFCWRRAIRRARAAGVESVLVTTNLTLWRADTRAVRRLRRLGIAPVVIVHRPYQTVFEDPLGERAARYGGFYRSAARILTMTAFVREWIETNYHPEPAPLPFPHPHFGPLLDRVSPDESLSRRLSAWAGEAPVIAFLSNMRPEQGLEVLLAALPRLPAEFGRWRLLLVSSGGSPGQVEAVERRLRESGLRERVFCRFDTYSPPELRAYAEASTVVVTPYSQATQSGVLALASGAGRPVVATEVGGLPEMVRPGVNGELAPSRNPAALADALGRVLSRLDHYREGALACREEIHSPKEAAETVTEALRAAAGDLGPRPGEGGRPGPAPDRR